MLLRRIIKNTISFVKYHLPVNRAVTILMYHSIGDNSGFFTVKPETFEKQMFFLKNKRYNVIGLANLARNLEVGNTLPKKTVVLTFDDGYVDNYNDAFPILKKYKFPATIFLITDLVGNTLTNSRGLSLKMLNWHQINEMHKSGLIDFQPHGLTHQKLNKLSIEEIEQEVKNSKLILEERLNKSCNLFCYPKGRYNQDVIEILKENDFKVALTIKKGFIKKGDNLFALKRNSINSTVSFIQFKARL